MIAQINGDRSAIAKVDAEVILLIIRVAIVVLTGIESPIGLPVLVIVFNFP